MSKPADQPPMLASLILATAIAVLSINMFLPSLAHIAEDFGVDYGLANLSVAGFLAVSAVMQLLLGPLSDRFGRRPIMLWSFAIYALASLGCALAQDFWVFLTFRIIQSVVVAGQVVSRAMVRDMYDTKEAASKLGYVQMVMALAPILGPSLGGVLDMLFGWRAGFWLYTLMGAGLLWLFWCDLGETNKQPSMTMGAQLRSYPELFRARRFWGYSFCLAFAIGGFYAYITGVPLVAAAWFDLNPAMAGLGIGIITCGFMAGNFFTGLFAERLSLIRLILIGRLISLVGPCIGFALFAMDVVHAAVFFGSAVCVGFGNGLTVATASTGVMSVRPHLAGSASGLSGALVVALGAVLTTLTGAVVSPANAPFAVLGIIIASSTLGLLSALYVAWVDAREPLPSVQ